MQALMRWGVQALMPWGVQALMLTDAVGVQAVAAAQAGAAHVIALDIDPYSAAAVLINADLNQVPLTNLNQVPLTNLNQVTLTSIR